MALTTDAQRQTYLSDMNRRINEYSATGNKDMLTRAQNEYGRVQQVVMRDKINRLGGAPGDNGGTGSAVLGGVAPRSTGGSGGYSYNKFGQKTPAMMSFEDAFNRAKGQLDPAYQASRTNAGAVSAQQQQLLRQQLNSRGQLNGGLATQGAIDTSAALQKALADIDVGYNTQSNTLANELQQRDFENKRASFSDALSAYQANESNRYNAANFNYRSSRDLIADEQYQQTFAENARQFGMTYALQKAQDDWQKLQGEAQLTGMYNGQATLDKIGMDRDYQMAQAQLGLQRAAAARAASGGGGGGGSYSVGDGGESDVEMTPTQERSSFNSYIGRMNDILNSYTAGNEKNSYANTMDYTANSGNRTNSSSSMQALINDIYSDPYVSNAVKENALAQIFNNQSAIYLLGLNPGHSR